VLGVDPAADGFTAMIVMGWTGPRARVRARRLQHGPCPPELLIAKIKGFVTKYNVRELIVERNAFQGFLTRQRDLRDFCYAHRLPAEPALHRRAEVGREPRASPRWRRCSSRAPTHDPDATSGPAAGRVPPDHPAQPEVRRFVDELTTQLTTWQPREGSASSTP
jgi:hypothetical protein